tara:strand:+ start:27234 stop:27449 length:216 start_codon:yes stop_codon:yes gene_type:complete
MLLPAALKLLSPKLIMKIIDYVTKENDLDIKMRATIEEVASHKEEINALKNNLCKPSNICTSCGKEIKNVI